MLSKHFSMQNRSLKYLTAVETRISFLLMHLTPSLGACWYRWTRFYSDRLRQLNGAAVTRLQKKKKLQLACRRAVSGETGLSAVSVPTLSFPGVRNERNAKQSIKTNMIQMIRLYPTGIFMKNTCLLCALLRIIWLNPARNHISQTSRPSMCSYWPKT